jgi:AcrR family transcriptional regulator
MERSHSNTPPTLHSSVSSYATPWYAVGMETDLEGRENGTRPRGPGGRPRRTGVTEAILEATIALSAEGGIEDVTLDAIAARAGVARPTIYRRWESKEALLEEAMAMMIQQMVVVPQPGSIRDELIEWISVQIERMQSPLRSLWVAYFNVERASLAKDAIRRGHDLEADIIRRAVERGELRPDTDPDFLVELIFAMVWYQTTAYDRRLDSSFGEILVDTVLNSWLADPQPVIPADRAKARRRKVAARG